MDNKVIERNLSLVTEITKFILQDPSILDKLPDDFQLIILPENDPELSLYNLELLATSNKKDNKAVVMVRLDDSQINLKQNPPQLYIPLAA